MEFQFVRFVIFTGPATERNFWQFQCARFVVLMSSLLSLRCYGFIPAGHRSARPLSIPPERQDPPQQKEPMADWHNATQWQKNDRFKMTKGFNWEMFPANLRYWDMQILNKHCVRHSKFQILSAWKNLDASLPSPTPTTPTTFNTEESATQKTQKTLQTSCSFGIRCFQFGTLWALWKSEVPGS